MLGELSIGEEMAVVMAVILVGISLCLLVRIHRAMKQHCQLRERVARKHRNMKRQVDLMPVMSRAFPLSARDPELFDMLDRIPENIP